MTGRLIPEGSKSPMVELDREGQHTRIARLIGLRILWHPALSDDCTKGELRKLAEDIATDVVGGTTV